MKKVSKVIITATLFLILLLANSSNLKGYQPIISSRVSEILEITSLQENLENKSLFNIKVEVEILNRAATNQTVVELSDVQPKTIINASLADSTLQLEQISYAHATIMRYTYQPGITTETSLIEFYINKSGITQLPDGNYTLWRPINTAYPFINETTAEAKLTFLTVKDGEIEVTYPDFNWEPVKTNKIPYELLTPLGIGVIIGTIVYLRRRHFI
ncbi:MAG: hypothetical protein ACTSYD_06545 [Candidatus Heimdallarchaeaceae archaeon]